MKNKNYKLTDLLKINNIVNLNKLIKDVIISNVSDLINAKKNYLSFCSSPQYVNLLKNTKASAIIISEKLLKYMPENIIPVVCQKPEVEFIKLSIFFYPDSYFSKISYKHINAREIKKKYKNLKFGNNLYLEDNVKIGKNVFIGNNVTIKKDCQIGSNVVIGSNVIIENSIISDNVHICDGSILGKKGFGFRFVDNNCLRIPHIGKVIVHDGAEIGSHCVIDRGSVTDTEVGKNTFLDNFVHIAHNVKIGSNCILAAQVGIAGSTVIGNNVVIGGQSGISGHLFIGNNVRIGGKSGVVKNIKDNEIVMGYPAKPFREFVKINKAK